MATITDKGTYIQLMMNPNVKSVEQINKPTEGYTALIGLNNEDRHVISYVNYAKEFVNEKGVKVVRTIQDILSKVDELKNCSRCSTLDKENLKIESISLSPPSTPSAGFMTPQSSTVPVTAGTSPVSGPKKSMKDVFADQFFNAYLTNPGKYLFGMMFGDEDMISESIPQDPESQARFIGEMVDFMSGDIGLMRSPEEAKEYLSVLKSSSDSDSGKTSKSKLRRFASNVIY
jgi:hypothetical protein